MGALQGVRCSVRMVVIGVVAGCCGMPVVLVFMMFVTVTVTVTVIMITAVVMFDLGHIEFDEWRGQFGKRQVEMFQHVHAFVASQHTGPIREQFQWPAVQACDVNKGFELGLVAGYFE